MKKRVFCFGLIFVVLASTAFGIYTYLPEVLPGERIHVKIFLTVNGKKTDSQAPVFFRSRYEKQEAEKKFVSREKDGAYHMKLSGKNAGQYNIKFRCDSDMYQGCFKEVPVLGVDYKKLKDWYASDIECHINLVWEDGKWIAAYRVNYTESGRGKKASYIVRDNKILESGSSSLVCFGS